MKSRGEWILLTLLIGLVNQPIAWVSPLHAAPEMAGGGIVVNLEVGAYTLEETGAGDTVIATFTAARAAGGSWREAAELANIAGGLVVMKRGTATVSARELTAAVTRDLGGR